MSCSGPHSFLVEHTRALMSWPVGGSGFPSEAQTISVVHGRLREKMDGKILVNTIGTVLGWENKMVQVRVSCTVHDKTKAIDHGFRVDVLEPQKDACRLCADIVVPFHE